MGGYKMRNAMIAARIDIHNTAADAKSFIRFTSVFSCGISASQIHSMLVLIYSKARTTPIKSNSIAISMIDKGNMTINTTTSTAKPN